MGAWMTFTSGFNVDKSHNLVLEPCPTICAAGGGLAGCTCYWIEGDGRPPTKEELDFMTKNKPPYKIPSTSAIHKIPWNGYKVASTFSGCGGSCLGYRMAGYQVVWANEFIQIAQESYRANHPSTILDGRDITTVHAEEILEATGLKVGELDILDGSPPCQGFSLANKNRMTGKAKTYENGITQENEQLFFAYVGLLHGLQPKVFIAENVRGMTVGKAKDLLGDFQDDMFNDQSGTILRALMGANYIVRYQILNAADYGVPQSRQRVIFIGVRKDIAEEFGLQPSFPKPLGYQYSVNDACPWIMGITNPAHGYTKENAFDIHRPAFTIPATIGASYQGTEVTARRSGPPPRRSGPPPKRMLVQDPSGVPTEVKLVAPCRMVEGKYSAHTVDLAKPVATITCASPGNDLPVPLVEPESGFKSDGIVGKAWDRLKPGENDPKHFSIVKASPDKPSPTLTACGSWQLHPFEKRKFSIAEIKRLGGFPDDYVLKGKYNQQWERVGNSVPPPLMKHIAAEVRRSILDRIPKGVEHHLKRQ